MESAGINDDPWVGSVPHPAAGEVVGNESQQPI